MQLRKDTSNLYDLGNGYYADSEGNRFNSNGWETRESQMAREQRIQAQNAAREASRQKEIQMWSDAVNKAGGFSFLKPFRLGRRGGLGLVGGFLVFEFAFSFVYMLYKVIVGPVFSTIKMKVNSVRAFFQSVGSGIASGAMFIWDKIKWLLFAWPRVIRDIFSPLTGFSFLSKLLIRVVCIAELLLIVAYIIYFIKRFKEKRRIPFMEAADLYEPAIILFVGEFLLWLIIHRFGWSIWEMLYNALCMTFWTVALEWVICLWFRKKHWGI